MAGLAEQGRRLRAREVPPPPVTRSVAASCNNAGQSENPRRTKIAAKRAAVDDNNRVANTAPAQHAKKRAALANLTNYANAPTTRNGAPAAKSSAVAPAAITKGKTRASGQIREVVETQHAAAVPVLPKKPGSSSAGQSQGRISGANDGVPFQSDENISPGKTLLSVQAASEEESDLIVLEVASTGVNESEAIASLERKTQNNLYISKDSKARARQGHLFDDNQAESEGWSSKNYTDIDSDHKDPQMCSSYAIDIYQHLRMAELKRRPTTEFMENVQADINASMRGILIDWLVEVAEEYKLVPDTLYLTISYIDRFLSANVVNRQRLQLLGVACMLIAAKYEEICAPQVEEFCYITDNTYCREEVLEMERRVLNHLRFELTGPTTKSFLRRFIRAAQAGHKTPTLQLEFLGNYLAELTLVEYGFLQYLPSMIAGSAVFMAKVTIDPTAKPWNTTLQHYTGYRPSELKECVKAIYDLQCNTKSCTLPAIREKYRQHKFKCVATLAPPAIIPSEYFEDF